MKEPDLYNLVLISKGKETGIAKRRLVHDGSRLTKRLPELLRQYKWSLANERFPKHKKLHRKI